MRTALSGEVREHIGAPPQKVWALLANLEQMGQWSPECYRVQWLDGASSPATAGARFRGWNRLGWMRWSTTCQVKTAEPGRELAFSTIQKDRELVRWRYLLEPASGGTDLIESFQVIWLPFTVRVAEDMLMRDRDRCREEAMRTTLSRIKAYAEGAPTAAARPSTVPAPHGRSSHTLCTRAT
jgi:uncharacterized protein YndB with AHSA1/START domain